MKHVLGIFKKVSLLPPLNNSAAKSSRKTYKRKLWRVETEINKDDSSWQNTVQSYNNIF